MQCSSFYMSNYNSDNYDVLDGRNSWGDGTNTLIINGQSG